MSYGSVRNIKKKQIMYLYDAFVNKSHKNDLLIYNKKIKSKNFSK